MIKWKGKEDCIVYSNKKNQTHEIKDLFYVL
ncbi:hypothetical protein ES705_14898 [subsurface metagenome]